MVSVSELSKKLNTSVVTIRKDLKLLAEQQLLTCVAGGAIPYQETAPAASYSSSFSGCSNLPLKRAVAQEAAKLISDGDSLIITSGSTPHLTLTYAAHSQRKRLKILTDSLKIAMDFCHYSDYQVIILGGEIYAKESFIHGRDAVRQASLYMADKAILTMDGVDADEGLTAFHVEGGEHATGHFVPGEDADHRGRHHEDRGGELLQYRAHHAGGRAGDEQDGRAGEAGDSGADRTEGR